MTIDELLKLDETTIKIYTISELVSIIEILDTNAISLQQEVEMQRIKKEEDEQNKLRKRKEADLSFAKDTLAPDKEIEDISKEIDEIVLKLEKLRNKREDVFRESENKKYSIIELAKNAIINMEDIKIELARQDEIMDLQNIIESYKKEKEELENSISVDKALSIKTPTEQQISKLEEKINKIKAEIREGITELNSDTSYQVAKMRNMIADLKNSDKESQDMFSIKKARLEELSSLINFYYNRVSSLKQMSYLDYKNNILKKFENTNIDLNYNNQSNTYDEFRKSIKNVNNNLVDDYTSLLDELSNLLKEIRDPQLIEEIDLSELYIDGVGKLKTLEEIIAAIKLIKEYIEELRKEEELKIEDIDMRFIKSNVCENGLMTLPFIKDNWIEYFGSYFTELVFDFNQLNAVNSRYNSIKQKTLLSKCNNKLLNKYEYLLNNYLRKLYNSVLSNYIMVSNQTQVSIFDYENINTLELYVDRINESRNNKILELENLINDLIDAKKMASESLSDKYNRIDKIKITLNDLLMNKPIEKVTIKNNVSENESIVEFDDLFDDSQPINPFINIEPVEDIVDNIVQEIKREDLIKEEVTVEMPKTVEDKQSKSINEKENILQQVNLTPDESVDNDIKKINDIVNSLIKNESNEEIISENTVEDKKIDEEVVKEPLEVEYTSTEPNEDISQEQPKVEINEDDKPSSLEKDEFDIFSYLDSRAEYNKSLEDNKEIPEINMNENYQQVTNDVPNIFDDLINPVSSVTTNTIDLNDLMSTIRETE